MNKLWWYTTLNAQQQRVSVISWTLGWWKRGKRHGSQESGSPGEEAEERKGGAGEEATAGAGPGAEEGSSSVRLHVWTCRLNTSFHWHPPPVLKVKGGGGAAEERRWQGKKRLHQERIHEKKAAQTDGGHEWSHQASVRKSQEKAPPQIHPQRRGGVLCSVREADRWGEHKPLKAWLSLALTDHTVLQGCVLEASPCRASLWRHSIWLTMTEISQTIGRTAGETHTTSNHNVGNA